AFDVSDACRVAAALVFSNTLDPIRRGGDRGGHDFRLFLLLFEMVADDCNRPASPCTVQNGTLWDGGLMPPQVTPRRPEDEQVKSAPGPDESPTASDGRDPSRARSTTSRFRLTTPSDDCEPNGTK